MNQRHRVGVAAVAVLAASGLSLLAATPPASADGVTAGSVLPGQDPFYTAPAGIAGYAPGQIVATRPIPKASTSSTSAWQISYRSNDSHGQAELAVTSLLVPTKAWTGTGTRPIVSEQVAEDSVGLQCAPSYGLATSGSVLNAGGLLSKGWAVAIPDYEGPRSAWMAGPQAGHAVLDGIRAVRSFTGAAGIGTANPWALDGYSGGAQATGWAAQLQPTYAPEITLVGAALGGLPADPAVIARSLDGGPFSGFELAATIGLSADFPEAGIPALMNARGQADIAKGQGKCLSDILTQFAFRTIAQSSTVRDPLAVPSVAAVLRKDTLGATAPVTPVYDYHADTDEIVPVHQDTVAAQAWCAGGATVQIVRDLVGEHALEGVLRAGSAQAFLADRFAGKKPVSSC